MCHAFGDGPDGGAREGEAVRDVDREERGDARRWSVSTSGIVRCSDFFFPFEAKRGPEAAEGVRDIGADWNVGDAGSSGEESNSLSRDLFRGSSQLRSSSAV